MKTAKEEALDLLDRLPDDVSMDTLVAELQFRASVLRGLAQADRGEGISPKSIPFVFDRYLQAERRGKPDGLGLGLTIARHIIELHGGTIEASSRGKGYGAVFTVQLPTSLKDDNPAHNPNDGLTRFAKT